MGKYDDDDYEPGATSTEEPEATKDDDGDTADEFNETQARKQISRGWGRAEQVKSQSSAFAEKFTPDATVRLVKFLDDEPYTSYQYHWLEGREGQKSFTCIDKLHPKGCPLCSAGSKAAAQFCFNVAVFVDGDWVNKSYQGGSRLFDQLKAFHQDDKTGPLSKGYWAISKTGKKGSTTTNTNPVKERDLEEDWAARAISDKEAAALDKGKYDASIVYIPKRETLLDIASEELGD